MNKKISAYVPCYNNEKTVLKTIRSIQNQTVPVDELFVVDDGSKDNSVNLIENKGITVYKNEKNMGRGFTRAKAMELAKNELVLCCDATNVLSEDFIEKSLHWFDDQKVAGVYGKLETLNAKTVVERWRSRHLLRLNEIHQIERDVCYLSTWGALVRKSAVLRVGNYDKNLVHTEDNNLATALFKKKYKLVYDPTLKVISFPNFKLMQVMEKRWRWYDGKDERFSIRSFLREIKYSIKGSVFKDIRDRDFLCIPISLFVPYYLFWKNFKAKLKVK